MDRRKFIQASAVIGTTALVGGCESTHAVKGSIVGASSKTGHLLRDLNFSESKIESEKDIVIIGGGISGLSAARWLYKNNISSYVLLELEDHVGGNASSGANEISGYPWGAHYIPTPNNDLKEYLSFLEEIKVITGWNKDGLPVYNEFYLCFDPQERLYINGRWQEGLVPDYGVPAAEKQQIASFLTMMEELKHAKGKDGKDAFAIPVNNSSADEVYTKLDKITMKQWLLENNFTSEYLHWYVNYCTRDDFGTSYDKASAWIGIHYFAARKGRGDNANDHDVITWPSGNGWLVNELKQNISTNIISNALVVKIDKNGDALVVTYLDTTTKALKSIKTKQCILAVPQFIAGRLLNDHERVSKAHAQIQYAPWMVANLTVSGIKERSGAPLSWDNVMYNSRSLGYVHAGQELLSQSSPKKNITYYLPLDEHDVAEERMLALKRTHAEWSTLILNDLEKIHPNIKEATEELNIMLWGHAMAQPLPGMIFGNMRKELSASVNNNIHFAHTDLAGISIFEEAFYQGMHAAKKVIEQLNARP